MIHVLRCRLVPARTLIDAVVDSPVVDVVVTALMNLQRLW